MKLVVFTGAGMSAESGLKTFRAAKGLWESHKITDVATPEAFERQPEVVHQFYNARRAQLAAVKPHEGHLLLARLQDRADVKIITQNVDNLHERAGSQEVLHVHGRLDEARSAQDPNLIWNIGYAPLTVESKAPDGHPARPNVVWFGEEVPAMRQALKWVYDADYFLIVGTSLKVYPAAGLVYAAPKEKGMALIDPKAVLPRGLDRYDVKVYRTTAIRGLQKWLNETEI